MRSGAGRQDRRPRDAGSRNRAPGPERGPRRAGRGHLHLGERCLCHRRCGRRIGPARLVRRGSDSPCGTGRRVRCNRCRGRCRGACRACRRGSAQGAASASLRCAPCRGYRRRTVRRRHPGDISGRLRPGRPAPFGGRRGAPLEGKPPRDSSNLFTPQRATNPARRARGRQDRGAPCDQREGRRGLGRESPATGSGENAGCRIHGGTRCRCTAQGVDLLTLACVARVKGIPPVRWT